MLGAIAQDLKHGTVSSDSAREEDIYAIYSLMLSNPQTSHGPDDNSRYLIEEKTGRAIPLEPCVEPPKERETEFREVLRDFENRKETPRQLRRSLSIGKPYVLLTPDDFKEFAQARSQNRIEKEVFSGVKDIFRLSDVYFNQKRTLALTAISTWCGSLCGQWQWKVFEKLPNGKWQERPWVSCFTIAQSSGSEH